MREEPNRGAPLRHFVEEGQSFDRSPAGSPPKIWLDPIAGTTVDEEVIKIHRKVCPRLHSEVGLLHVVVSQQLSAASRQHDMTGFQYIRAIGNVQ